MRRHPPFTRIATAVTLAAGALAFSGCALQPTPSGEEMTDAALPPGAAIPLKWSAGGNSGSVSHGWLKTFKDRRLNQIVAEGIAHNPNLRSAAAKATAAREQVTVIAAQMKPLVGADIGASTIREDDRNDWFHSQKGLLGVSWEPDVWGRVRSQSSAAEFAADAAELDYAYARQSLAAAIAKSWFLTTETLQLEALSERFVAINSELLELVEARFKAGKVDNLDVTESKADLSNARSQLVTTKRLAAEARRNLETLVGRYPAAELRAGMDYAAVPPPIRSGLPASLIQRRPDVVAAEMQVLAAFRDQESARLALLPNFSFGLDAGKISDGLISLLRLNPWMLHATVGMSVPIYTGGALEAQIRIADAKQQQAIANYGATVLEAFKEVENALGNGPLLDQQLKYDEQSLKDRSEAVRLAKIQFKAGKITLLSVLQLQQAEIASESALIKLRNARLANRINLHLALGGDFVSVPPKLK